MLKCHQVIIHAFHFFCPVTVCIRVPRKRFTLKAKLLANLGQLIAATVDIIPFDLLFLTGNALMFPVPRSFIQPFCGLSPCMGNFWQQKKCQKYATFTYGNFRHLRTNLNNVCFYPDWECTKINHFPRLPPLLLSPVGVSPTVLPQSACYRSRRRQIRTGGLNIISPAEYILPHHGFCQ